MARKMIRVTDAARILGVSPQTVRNYCASGRINYETSITGQRIFDELYIRSLVDDKNHDNADQPTVIYFYVRSSGGNDASMETQEDILRSVYGQPAKIFKDKASGLNENRKGIASLISHMKENQNEGVSTIVCVTNKDRLTRFGFKYFETIADLTHSEIRVIDSDETKEPLEILMQDFMSLLASFAGKFYRLRGWEHRKKFLADVTDEVNRRSHGEAS